MLPRTLHCRVEAAEVDEVVLLLVVVDATVLVWLVEATLLLVETGVDEVLDASVDVDEVEWAVEVEDSASEVVLE